MKRFPGAIVLTAMIGLVSTTTRADDAQANQVLDKAIKALGGQEKLAKASAFSVKAKGKITMEGNDNDFRAESIVEGIDRFRSSFEGEFNGNPVKAMTVLSGDKGWRKFGEVQEMDADAVKNEKRRIYLMVAPTKILPLKTAGFKLGSVTEEKVGNNPAVTIKATGPDGKDFTVSFDKESGLPVRLVATVAGWMGEEFVQEVLYSDYKEFDGIKEPTKVTVKRDGEPFISEQITEFKVLDKVPAETFAEPR
jgi:hypothetical protein